MKSEILARQFNDMLEQELKKIYRFFVQQERELYLQINTRLHVRSKYESFSLAQLEKELDEASSYIRGELSKRIEVRHTPKLRFVFDKSIEYGNKIEKIIESIHENE